ncbi:MAG: hypothetical protein ACO1SV_05720 [Fimbriimonas sp.]
MTFVALLASTVVPLQFAPPPDFKRRFIEVSRSTVRTAKGVETFHDHALDLQVRISGRLEDLTAVDTTILRSKIRMSPNYRDFDRIPEFERLAKGTVARAMVDSNGAVNEMNVLKANSYEKGPCTGYSLSAAASFGLHGFYLPGGLMRQGGKWKADFSMKRPMEFLGITVPEKLFPVHYTLAKVKDFGGVPHALVKFTAAVETDAEQSGKKFTMYFKEEGQGWINVKTGFPKEIRITAKIQTTGDDNSTTHRVTTVTAK